MEAIMKNIPSRRWWILIPVLFLTNLFCAMDRSVISVALVGTMRQELALNATMVGFVTGIVSIGLMILCVPGGQFAQKGNIKKFLGICIAGWSICSIATAFVTNTHELAIVRFLLGFTEGAVSPGISTLITFWFPDKNGERNRATSAYFTSSAMAQICMGPIAGTILFYYDWHVLFIVLGVASLVTLVLWQMFVYDRPSQAKWLSIEERDYIESTIREERERAKELAGSGAGAVKDEKFRLGVLLRNKYVWCFMGIGFFVNIGQNGFGMWMPTIIGNLTKANIMDIGLISALPNIFVLTGLWGWSFITSKIKSRRLTTAVPLFLFSIAMVLPTMVGNELSVAGNIALLCFIASFIQAWMPSFYTLPSLVLVKELDGQTRGLMALCMGLGSFVGPYAVGALISLTGSTKAAFFFMGGALIIAALITFVFPKEIGVTAKLSSGTQSTAAAK